MRNIAIPSTAKQLKTQKILNEYKKRMLGQQVADTAKKVDPNEFHAEIPKYISTYGMSTLASLDIREEKLYALPCVLKKNPFLLGYYRLLLGISEKQFYSSATGLTSFAKMEHEGVLGKINDEKINELCYAINKSVDIFLNNSMKPEIKDDIRDLPIMTLGIYADGVWRNDIGNNAAKNVFIAIKNIVQNSGAKMNVISNKEFEFEDSEGEKYKVLTASDPDVSIVKMGAPNEKKLCIEIKGGQDVANVHNRAGEAEKSHQKAKAIGWEETWTIIFFVGLTDDQQSKLFTESPTTDEWFDVNEICAQAGPTYEEFINKLCERLKI